MWPFGKKKRALRELMAAKGGSYSLGTKEKTRTYTKTISGPDEEMPRRREREEKEKPERTPFEPPRLLTSEEVWERPTLGGMKRAYFGSPRKEARAAAAAGRAFRKGKMS